MHAVIQWLRQEGADWPDELCYSAIPWPDASIAWCRLKGCDSPLNLQDNEVNDNINDDQA